MKAPPRTVARVRDDREMAQLLHDRDRGDVEGVARRRLECADTALAEHDVVVAAREDVLGRQQPLLDGGREASLQHHRLARVTKLAQQRVILHVARADLEEVGVAIDELDLADVHHLGDELQIVRVGAGPEHLQAFLAETLKAVGG